MPTFNVSNAAPQSDGKSRFIVRGYPTGRTASTYESKATADHDEALRWAEAANNGEFLKEAHWGVFADD